MSNNTDHTLGAEYRTSFGKGAARKIRAAGKIPAVIYGHGTDPQHVTLPGHEISLIIRKANAVINLDIEGTQQLTLVKDVQRDPVRQIIEHLDLLVVKKGELIEAEVPVHVEGDSFPGTLAMLEFNTLRLLVEATNIPESVVVNIEGLVEGDQVLAGGVELPKGAKLADEEDLLVVNIVMPRASVADSEEGEEEGAEADAS
ncbi:50S ribosomal protein L25/general stress protein Ctc [Lysinibacter sp. HNR]|uniref:50S ribosomal protein L25/general stress protein Ctc n=1 Tax=Lysinibacter sp. HNR TaxID=3031408 RepID=UPI002434888F|nr:50S ribosomal protein L25/general stress protein Ctc [Lysinibacter sp. HNR]WGD38230.1 50S ribosomal protein L25/general stress protein Ctc [Lysinibacter sp. HNR]